MQSSRSKSTICLRKGSLLRFQSNSRWAQRLQGAQVRAKALKRCLTWSWIDCNQSLQPYWSQMKCDLSEERASAQIRIEQHSNFRWRSKKPWKQCLVWFWIDCNQSLQPNRSPMKCNVWKQSSAAVNSFDRTSFHFQFEDFLSNLPLWTIIYWVTDQPFITWSRISVLNWLMSCLMSNEQKLC